MRGLTPFVAIYALLCVGALLLIPANAAGWFGMTPDPLVGIYAIVFALPWSLASRWLGEIPLPGIVMIGICMLLNIATLLAIGWLLDRRLRA